MGACKKLSVKIEKNKSILTALIEGDIDHHTAKDIRFTIDNAIEEINPNTLELDFKEVQFMDSSGIGLIMGRFRLMKLLNGNLKVVNVPDHIDRLIKLSGLKALGIVN